MARSCGLRACAQPRHLLYKVYIPSVEEEEEEEEEEKKKKTWQNPSPLVRGRSGAWQQLDGGVAAAHSHPARYCTAITAPPAPATFATSTLPCDAGAESARLRVRIKCRLASSVPRARDPAGVQRLALRHGRVHPARAPPCRLPLPLTRLAAPQFHRQH